MKAKPNQIQSRQRRGGARKKAKRMRIFLLCFSLLVVFAGMIFRYTEIAKLGRQAAELETRIEELSAKRDALRLQMSPHTKKSYIEQVAKNELAMDYRTQEILIADATEEPEIQTIPPGKNPTLFGQLSVFVFSLLYR